MGNNNKYKKQQQIETTNTWENKAIKNIKTNVNRNNNRYNQRKRINGGINKMENESKYQTKTTHIHNECMETSKHKQ